MGPDFSSVDGVWLLNIETGRLVSRRTYKLFDGFPFLSNPSNVISLTSLLKSLEVIRAAQDERYSALCEQSSDSDEDDFGERDVGGVRDTSENEYHSFDEEVEDSSNAKTNPKPNFSERSTKWLTSQSIFTSKLENELRKRLNKQQDTQEEDDNMDGQDIYEPDTKETLTSQSVPKSNEEKDTPFDNVKLIPICKSHLNVNSTITLLVLLQLSILKNKIFTKEIGRQIKIIHPYKKIP